MIKNLPLGHRLRLDDAAPERGLAAATLAHDGQGLPRLHRQVDIVERHQLAALFEEPATKRIDLGEIFDGKQRCHASASSLT
jgi:hypothetical protein